MEQMTRRILLATFLGILVGLAVGYSPSIQPGAPPRAQLMMSHANQPNIAARQAKPAPGPIPLLIALLAGLAIAVPVFLIAKARTS
jgi:hypothetical protein